MDMMRLLLHFMRLSRAPLIAVFMLLVLANCAICAAVVGSKHYTQYPLISLTLPIIQNCCSICGIDPRTSSLRADDSTSVPHWLTVKDMHYINIMPPH